MVGKWHLCPTVEMNLASTRRNWPTGRGFERWYGFLGAETNQWYPDLVYDNHPVDQPKPPEEGYHLTEDLTDKALEFIKDSKVLAPDKPFFLYYAPGAATRRITRPRSGPTSTRVASTWATKRSASRPLPARRRWVSSRPDTELPAAQPDRHDGDAHGPEGPAVPAARRSPGPGIRSRRRSSDCSARMAEVYAGFLAHADHHIGRLLDYLEESGQRDNTLVILVSDNGARRGRAERSVNENKFFNGVPDDMRRTSR